MDLNPLPIRGDFVQRARELGATKIHIEFEGGSDQGYVNVQTSKDLDNENIATFAELLDNYSLQKEEKEENTPRFARWKTWITELRALEGEIENWAYTVYDYSGAGDGHDYGDSITYDLVSGRVSSQDWWYARTDGDTEEFDMIVDDPVPEVVPSEDQEPRLRGGELPEEDE